VDESLRKLRTDYVDLLLLSSPKVLHENELKQRNTPRLRRRRVSVAIFLRV
jgi:predicted oxidoreductase